MEMGSSSSSNSNPNSSESPLKIGLKFGQKIYFEDVGLTVPPKFGDGLSPVGGGGPAPRKKGRSGSGRGGGVNSGGGGGQPQPPSPPRCQVQGCRVDLSDAKTYYSRHKVCGMHSKTPKVIVKGLEQRFCQQCSRFHRLPEFDQGKRSCRRRLAGHNERRRKPPPGSLLSARCGSLSSSIFENNGRAGGFLMDFSAYPRLNAQEQWPNARASDQVMSNLPTAIGKFPPHPWQSNSENPPPDLVQGSANRTVYPPNLPSGGCFNGVSDSVCALSLLSNQPSCSRNLPSSLGESCYSNSDGARMIQPAATDGGGTMGHFASTSWGFKTNEVSSNLHGMHPPLGLGPMLQSASNDYPGELELDQQGGRNYVELEHSRIYDSSAQHIHWSL